MLEKGNREQGTGNSRKKLGGLNARIRGNREQGTGNREDKLVKLDN
jgi:hypothetical protein